MSTLRKIAIPKVGKGGLAATILASYSMVGLDNLISTAHFPKSGILEIRKL